MVKACEEDMMDGTLPGYVPEYQPPLSPPPSSSPAQAQPVSVLLTRPFSFLLTYLSPEPLSPGTMVQVPLGRGQVIGCVWEHDFANDLPPDLQPPASPAVPSCKNLRVITKKLENTPPLPESLRRFIDWVAAYTMSSPGLVLAMAVRVVRGGGSKPSLGWVLASRFTKDAAGGEEAEGNFRLTPARRAVLAAASGTEPQITAELARKSGASESVIRGLGALGVLKSVALAAPSCIDTPRPDYEIPTLSPDQSQAASFLCQNVADRVFSATLLEGVTGSGKTEVYFEAVASALRQGKQVLVLLPEIALTAQWVARFTRRFGAAPAIWHSELGQKNRRETWCAIASGAVRVVVGARSALFLPFITLGLVIVDEEHDPSFKQEEGVCYHGRDMAVLRGRLDQAPVILASATPSLETLVNVEQGRYRHVKLAGRHGGASLPDISIIDMRKEGPEGRSLFLAPALCTAIEQTLAAGEQAMLFLNRRGYAPLTLCRACGYRLQCPHCSAWLVEHRTRNLLVCHHCDYQEPKPSSCPECHAEESLVPVGPGVERIKEEAQARFGEAGSEGKNSIMRLLVMATDTMGTSQVVENAVKRISTGEVNLIIGTQMVAKGWHFPNLTLVGVVDADLGLSGGDLRAAERTMQLLHQVSGRAGRGEKAGRVLLQSYVADHPVMQALKAQDFENFMAQEAEQRRPGFWPPYGRLAALVVSAEKERQAEDLARQLALTAPQGEGIQVLGPAPAPLALLRGRYRQRLLLRTRRGIALQPLLRHWLAGHKPGAGARIDVDIDPISFM